MLLKCQDVRVSRQAWAMFCEHSRSGTLGQHFIKIAVSFLEDGFVKRGLWGGVSVRMTRPGKKNALCGNAVER